MVTTYNQLLLCAAQVFQSRMGFSKLGTFLAGDWLPFGSPFKPIGKKKKLFLFWSHAHLQVLAAPGGFKTAELRQAPTLPSMVPPPSTSVSSPHFQPPSHADHCGGSIGRLTYTADLSWKQHMSLTMACSHDMWGAGRLNCQGAEQTSPRSSSREVRIRVPCFL